MPRVEALSKAKGLRRGKRGNLRDEHRHTVPEIATSPVLLAMTVGGKSAY